MIYAIMTAFNEEGPLKALLPTMPHTLLGHDLHVVVVDDGSADQTAAVAEEHGCTVIRSRVNRGKGASLRAGLESIRGENSNAVVLIDADGQHDPGALADLVQPVLNTQADIVIGSRYLGDPGRGATPRNRYLVRLATVKVLSQLFAIECSDPFSGYRVLSPAAVTAISFCGDRYESELEGLFCAQRSQLRVTERPVPRIYGAATSKMGARGGRIIGRTRVVMSYARAIVSAVPRRNERSAPSELHPIA